MAPNENGQETKTDQDFFSEFRDSVSIDPFEGEDEEEKASGGAVTAVWLGVLIGIAVAAAIAWDVVGQRGFDSENPDEVPVIKRHAGPIKVRPTEPGGMEIPNRDKTVYDRMVEASDEGEKIERLLPAPEQPVQPPQTDNPVENYEEIKGNDVAESILEPETVDVPEKVEKSIKEVEVSEPVAITRAISEKKEAEKEARKIKEAKKVPAAEEKPVEEKTVAEKVVEQAEKPVVEKEPEPEKKAPVEKAAVPVKEPAPKVEIVEQDITKMVTVKETPEKTEPVEKPVVPAEPAKTYKGPWQVQLVAVRSSEAAEKAWSQFAVKHSKLLGKLPHNVVKVNLGAKGIYYRLRAGGFDSRAEATKLCSALKKSKQGCIIVRR